MRIFCLTCAVLLAAVLGMLVSTDASAQVQYCAQRQMQPTGACFATMAEAEAFMREEPAPVTGASKLTLDRVSLNSAGKIIRSYVVRPVPHEGFVAALHSATTTTPWGGGGRTCDGPTPVPGVNNGCQDEGSLLARVLVGYPFYGNYSGHYIGSYTPEIPGTWGRMLPAGGGVHEHVVIDREPTDWAEKRKIFVPDFGTEGHESRVSRKDYYRCPLPYYASSSGMAGMSWPNVCWNNRTGQIVVTSRQFNSCAKDGNPCVATTGNKEYREEDFSWEGQPFTRAYNSIRDMPLMSAMGDNWAHSYSDRLLPPSTSTGDIIWIRSDGYFEEFKKVTDSKYRSLNDTGYVLFREPDERVVPYGRWRIRDAGGRTLWFDESLRLRKYELGGRQYDLRYCDAELIAQGVCSTLGLLDSVQSATGRYIRFHYSTEIANVDYSGTAVPTELISSISLDGASQVQFTYAGGRLTAAFKPSASGLTGRQYVYGEQAALCRASDGSQAPGCSLSNFPFHLTGVIDEAGARLATYTYDSFGRAASSEHAGGAGRVQLVYPTATVSEVSLASGLTKKYTFAGGDFRKPTATQFFDSAGLLVRSTSNTYNYTRVSRQTSPSGARTDFTYNDFHLITKKEGLTSAGYSTAYSTTEQTDWSSDFPFPIERRLLNNVGALVKKEVWSYTVEGWVRSSAKADPSTGMSRGSVRTYCSQSERDLGLCPQVGLVMGVDGPRADVLDVTTYSYYDAGGPPCLASSINCGYRVGDLKKVTNALGHSTEILSYDHAGRPLVLRDANGVDSEALYDERGRVLSSTVKGSDPAEDRTTLFEYWITGPVKKVISPDGLHTSFEYDDAHRLTAVVDSAGNRIEYTLDNSGNRIAENTKGSGGVLKRTLSRVYNTLGQLATQADAQANPTDFTYDAVGNTKTVTDALGHVTSNDYDPLNRLKRTLQDVGGIEAETKFEYDANDNLTKVTDPKGLDTTYTYNGFGDQVQLSSPDTGITTFTYDSAGNRASQTDARGISTTYQYDALNRLTQVGYPTSSLNVSYTYDVTQPVCQAGETFSVGRLTSMVDGSGSTQYCHDRFGQLVRKVQTTNGVALTLQYAYTKGGQLQAMTYPDGTVVDYIRNAQGQITEVGVAQPSQAREVLLTQATYHPFGPIAGWVYGNGRVMQRNVDLDYRPTSIQGGPGGLDLTYGHDAVGNLTSLSSGSPPPLEYGYDTLGRLTESRDGPTQAIIDQYTYDKTGNRTSFTDSLGTKAYAYPSTSHRLSSVGSESRTYDAVGNTLSIGTTREFDFNDAGRMSQVRNGGVVAMEYAYNGRGEQVRKHLGASETQVLYDETGRWVGDYVVTGAPAQQLLRMDDMPVGLLTSGGALKHVQPDHLGTPRAVLDPLSNVAIWTWDLKGEAFGATLPDQDADGDGTPLVFDMRFPGQRADSLSGLNHNYFRDYDSSIGRYTQSDPLGLEGGISTYAYANNEPSMVSDPTGLLPIILPRPMPVPIPAPRVAPRPLPYPVDPVLPVPSQTLPHAETERLPRTGACKASEWDACRARCPGRVNGCYVSISWKIRGVRGSAPIRSEERTVNCNCADDEFMACL